MKNDPFDDDNRVYRIQQQKRRTCILTLIILLTLFLPGFIVFLATIEKPVKIDFGSFVQKIADIIGEVELREHVTTHKLSHTYQSAAVVQNGIIIGELFRVHPEVEKRMI